MIERANRHLREVIASARESSGLDIPRAAKFVGLSENQFLEIESQPMSAPCSALYRVMAKFQSLEELAEANLEISALFFESSATGLRDGGMQRRPLSKLPVDPPSPEL